LLTSLTSIAIVKSSLFIFSFVFFLKRIVIDQDVSSRKRTKLLDSKLLAQIIEQALDTLEQKINNISIDITTKTKS